MGYKPVCSQMSSPSSPHQRPLAHQVSSLSKDPLPDQINPLQAATDRVKSLTFSKKQCYMKRIEQLKSQPLMESLVFRFK